MENETQQISETEKSEICIQSLQHYNEGTLIFKWYNITDWDSYESMTEDFIKYVKETTGDLIEEWMIADYSNFPCKDEYPDADEINAIMEAIKEHGTEPVKAFLSSFDASQLEHFKESYQGEYDTMEDFAYQLVNDCYNLDKLMGNLSAYFDYEKFARDLEIGGDYTFIDGYVFNNNF